MVPPVPSVPLRNHHPRGTHRRAAVAVARTGGDPGPHPGTAGKASSRAVADSFSAFQCSTTPGPPICWKPRRCWAGADLPTCATCTYPESRTCTAPPGELPENRENPGIPRIRGIYCAAGNPGSRPGILRFETGKPVSTPTGLHHQLRPNTRKAGHLKSENRTSPGEQLPACELRPGHFARLAWPHGRGGQKVGALRLPERRGEPDFHAREITKPAPRRPGLVGGWRAPPRGAGAAW